MYSWKKIEKQVFCSNTVIFFFFFNLPSWFFWVSVVACGIFSDSIWDLVPWKRDWTWAPCTGSRVLATRPPRNFVLWTLSKKAPNPRAVQFNSVQPLNWVQLFATPWTAARQASLSITSSQSLLILMPIESVMPSNHLILCRPRLLRPSVFHSIRVFSNESVLRIRWPKYRRFSFSISPSSAVHQGNLH